MTASDDERVARCGLSAIAGPGDLPLSKFVTSVGAVEAWRAIRAGTGPVPRLASRPRSDVDAETILAAGMSLGLRVVVPGDLEWPTQLEHLALAASGKQRASVPPFALWLRGKENLRMALLRSAAVVGSRASTPYGNRVAAELGAGLSEAGYATVSGGAYGIDASAHRGALAVGGLTVAVLAGGVDIAYPQGHGALLERIAAEGVLVSELPPGSHPTRVRFLERNRLIAAFTRGTVLVEAAVRSGALNTAAWARRLNRPVLGVPGPVTSAMSSGVHRELVARRAELVTGAADVVDVLDPLTGPQEVALFDLEPDPADTGSDHQLDALSARVLQAVPVRCPAAPGELAARVGVSADLVQQRLALLKAMDLVEWSGDGWRLSGTVPS